jgi:hypothetical protein
MHPRADPVGVPILRLISQPRTVEHGARLPSDGCDPPAAVHAAASSLVALTGGLPGNTAWQRKLAHLLSLAALATALPCHPAAALTATDGRQGMFISRSWHPSIYL